jgi:hypothetical protein
MGGQGRRVWTFVGRTGVNMGRFGTSPVANTRLIEEKTVTASGATTPIVIIRIITMDLKLFFFFKKESTSNYII